MNGAGWLSVRDPDQTGHFVAPGFSGTPVFTAGGEDVLGIVVAMDTDAGKRVAFVIPTEILHVAWPPLARPYRGLFAFEEEYARYFFGRDTFVDELGRKLTEKALLAVVGASGSGKSSVVMAGLVPRLRATGGWAMAAARPGDRPLFNLAYDLVPLLEPQGLSAGRWIAPAEEWEARLGRDPARLANVAQAVFTAVPGTERLLLALQLRP